MFRLPSCYFQIVLLGCSAFSVDHSGRSPRCFSGSVDTLLTPTYPGDEFESRLVGFLTILISGNRYQVATFTNSSMRVTDGWEDPLEVKLMYRRRMEFNNPSVDRPVVWPWLVREEYREGVKI